MDEQKQHKEQSLGALCLLTKRLLLRKPRSLDVGAVARQISHVEIIRNLSVVPWPYHRDDAIGWQKQIEVSWAVNSFTFGIFHQEQPDELIGVISLNGLLVLANPCPSIGYWLGVKHWGQGYMSEAVKAVLSFAFEQLKAPRIEATYLDANPASGRVMEKNGFENVQATMLWSRYQGCYLSGQLMRLEAG